MYHDLQEAFSDTLFQLVNPCFTTPLYFDIDWIIAHITMYYNLCLDVCYPINCEIPTLWNISPSAIILSDTQWSLCVS